MWDMPLARPHHSGVVKGEPGWARTWPKHHLRSTHVSNVTRSACKRKANGLAYTRCLSNTNDLATPLPHQAIGPDVV